MSATDPVHNPARYRFYRLLAFAGAAGTLSLRMEHHEPGLTIALWSVLLAALLALMVLDRRDRLQHRPAVSRREQS
jgi:hypothetical protein